MATAVGLTRASRAVDMRPGVFLALVMAIGAVLPAPLRAQDQRPRSDPQSPPRFATELVVTPERGETPRLLVPAATAVIDAETLPRAPIVQFSEIIGHLAGFHVQDEHPFGGRPLLSARGFFGGGEAEYVLVLLDGVPVSDPESGLVDWSLIPLSTIRRVEGSRGPGGSLYGDAAIGGVINVLTAVTEGGGRLVASAGGFETFTGDGTYGIRRPRFGFSAAGSAARTDGYRAHSSAAQLGGVGTLDVATDAARWRVSLNGHARNRDEPGPLTNAEWNHQLSGFDRLFGFDGMDRETLAVSIALGVPESRWQLRSRFTGNVRREDGVRTILLLPGVGDRQSRELSTSALDGSLDAQRTLRVAGRPVSLRAGADVTRNHVSTEYHGLDDAGAPGALLAVTRGHRWRIGSFLHSAWEVGSRLRLTTGIRWDHIADGFEGTSPASATHTAWSPRIGATFLIGPDTAAFVQVSRAFKAPTLDQLFDPRPYPDFAGGTFTIANPALHPQRATNFEMGVSGGSRVRWNALAYRMNVQNEIDFDVATFSYGNIGESRHLGMEVEAGTTWTRFAPSLKYALQQVTKPGDSRQLKNVPRHLVTGTLAMDAGLGLHAHVTYRLGAGAFLDDLNEYPIEGLSVLDVRVRKRLWSGEFFVDVLNAADNRYQQYGFTLTGFDGTVVPYSYPGAPRTIRCGWMASF